MTDFNPLLSIQLPIPFDRVKPDHVRPGIERLIEETRERIGAITSAGGPRTFANTVAALDSSTEPLDYSLAVVRHLEAVATTPELREAYNDVQPKASEFYSSIPLDPALWHALKEYAATEEALSLRGVKARFLKKTMDGFRRAGADLPPEGKKRLSEIDVELSTVATKFAQNVLDATARFEYYIEDETGLAGLPPSAVAAARQSAESKGKAGWRFTLQQPSYLAVLTYLDDRAVREQFWRAYNRRAAGGELDNATLIPRIVELRRAKAELLGFRNFADLVLEDRMAKNGATALSFTRDLEAKTGEPFARENRELSKFRQGIEGPQAPDPAPWDVAYYAEKRRKAEYDFDEEDLRPYFPLPRVVEGLFELVNRLYGIRVMETPGVPVWHPDTKFYEVRDEDGSLLGEFYADWYPRETKRGGAWMDAFLTAGGSRPHVGLMCGNLTPPLSGRPALLTHRDVETIFHEFGHLLHHLLSKVDIRSLAGTNVAWDFVELPSQIMENWCWEREALDLFAAHWETGSPIPDELFQKLKRARTYRSANGQMRQLGFGTVDLTLHIDYDPARDGEPLSFSRSILQRFTPAELPQDYAMLAAFTHLFGDPVGYGAGYYSYKWAEVLDADAFSRFLKEGIFNRETGMAFRRSILSKGDSEDPALLFREFMGRDPDPDALLKRLGLR